MKTQIVPCNCNNCKQADRLPNAVCLEVTDANDRFRVIGGINMEIFPLSILLVCEEKDKERILAEMDNAFPVPPLTVAHRNAEINSKWERVPQHV